jgi:hypothetical protein
MFDPDYEMSETEKSTEMTPKAEYSRRYAARQQTLRILERRESLGGLARVATFLGIPAVIYAASFRGGSTYLWALVAMGAFIAAVVWHRRIVASLERTRRAIHYYGKALARLDDHWVDAAPRGERYRRPEHRYALDLDLFGRASLFQLLCAARTRMGQDTLADWLLAPAEPDVIRSRQGAIDELRRHLDLREEIAVLDAPEKELHPGKLLAWAVGPAKFVDRLRPALAVVLAVASVAALVGWIGFGTGFAPFFAVAAVQGLFLLGMRRQIRELSKHTESALGELNLLTQMLQIMERQRFASPRLQAVIGRLQAQGCLPSQRIARLAQLVDYWDTIWHNQFVLPMAFILMLFVHLAYAIERWRVRYGRLVGEWLEAVGEFEGLCSLSAYAYEHPELPFPEIEEQERCFTADGLGHPLIPAGRRVTNDVALGSERRLLLVSGSNMSGKSTLLRSVGINAVLALAGAPVCAKRLRISPQTVAAVMRTADSLQEGVSGFYAEIKRLRTVFDLTAESLPVLFLFDEILHGTNSQDRRAGAEAVIEGLLERGAIGMATTHDLALAEIADRLKPRAANVHFEDQVTDGQMHFDYRLRPGVVPKGNGLVLMRLLGFDV